MRTIRALAIATAFAVGFSTLATAQAGRGFTDSWFWGVKAGGFTLADSGQQYIQSPLAGFDWLITRKNGGLYVSLGQAFFTQHSFTLRDPATIDSGFRPITVKNLRKLDVALVGFPGEHIRFHPYAGVGLTLNMVSEATPDGPFSNEDQLIFANNIIQNERAAFSPFLMGGVQWRLTRFSVFGQLELSAVNKNFVLYNQRPVNFAYEIGIRYNFGSAINRD